MSEIPAEALYDTTRLVDVSVSPDDEHVAFLTREYGPDQEETVHSLWVVPADGSRSPHRLTRVSDASSPEWSPDGSRLGFLATRDRDPELRVGRDDESEDDSKEEMEENGDDEDGDEEDSEEDDETAGSDEKCTQVWAFDMEMGGDARQVTDLDERVQSFDWSPDGEQLVVAARDPTEDQEESIEQRKDDGPIEIERLQHKFDGKGYLDEVTAYLFVVDVETRTQNRLDDANDGGHGTMSGLSPAWGPNDRIAFTANHTDWPDDTYVTDIYTIDPDGSDRRKITDSDLTAGTPRWSPSGDRLAFTGRDPENWYTPVEVYVTADGEEFTSVSGALDRTLGFGAAPLWLDESTLVVLLADGGWTRLARLSVDEPPERVFETLDRLATLEALDVGDSTLAVKRSRPGDCVTLDTLDAGQLETDSTDPASQIASFNDDIVTEYPMPDCQRVAFESADGTEIEGIAYYPEAFDPEDPEEMGLLLDIHGGPMSYDAPSFGFQDAYFTSRGYIVFKVNYRGSTSYGRDFCEVLRGSWGSVEVEDLLAGVDELEGRGWVDPDRLFPTGFSQGGVNTGYLVTRTDRWAAAAAEHGIYDLQSSFGTDDSQNWLEADFGLPWENPEAYEEHSSITDVEQIETPLLVTAGENDWRCPPTQSEQLYVSVRKQGVDAKLVIYQDEHHNIGDPDRAVHRLETLDEWFATYDPERDPDSESATD